MINLQELAVIVACVMVLLCAILFLRPYFKSNFHIKQGVPGKGTTKFIDTKNVPFSFDKIKEAESCLKYIKTKFVRSMLGVLKVTQDNNKDVWKYVPLQDFSKNSKIDWTKSISEIDQQLYAKYKLTKDEIDFIEKMIKPMAV